MDLKKGRNLMSRKMMKGTNSRAKNTRGNTKLGAMKETKRFRRKSLVWYRMKAVPIQMVKKSLAAQMVQGKQLVLTRKDLPLYPGVGT